MLDIYFESDKEVIHFCESLFSYNKQIELKWKTHIDWGNHLQFNEIVINSETLKAMVESMVDVFLTFRLPNEIRRIIKEDYYYTNNEEIEQILELSQWLIKGNIGHEKVDKGTIPIQLLQSLFMDNIVNKSTIHYDSIVKFRLNPFKERLLDCVGLAIDEFKQEEDHQDFVQMLRRYIANKQPTYSGIHVLQGGEFTFFKENGDRFSKIELRRIMYAEPLYIVGLDVDELNLAPLIAIAPEKIYIYGDNPSEPKTLTIINVFQERVVFEPYSHFPFPHALDHYK